MFGGDDDDNYSVLSLDLASDSLTKRKGSANALEPGSVPHWSARYGANPAQQHMRSESDSSTLSSAVRSNPHSRQTSGMNGGPAYDDYDTGQRYMEDEFGWSGSAGGIKGRDDRQVLRDQEFERQIEERRRKRLARKQGKAAPTAPETAPAAAAAAAPVADEGLQKEGTVKLRKAYRPVFAPTARDELSLDPPQPTDAAATTADADASTPVIPPPPRKGVTLVDDGVVEPPAPAPEPVQELQPGRFSRSRSFRLKRPNILRSHSDLVRGSNAAPAADQRLNASVGPGAYVAGKHYAFLDAPHSNGSPDVNGGAAGLKRGTSLKDKLGSALGRFGSTRRPTPGEAAAMPPMRRKTSRPPADGPLAEGDEGNGQEASGSGFGGLVRRMSKKLSEDPERVERHRREALYYEPPKLSHVLVGDRSPFPPRPPLGALSTAADQPPSFNRATAGRPSSYTRTPYADDKKASPI